MVLPSQLLGWPIFPNEAREQNLLVLNLSRVQEVWCVEAESVVKVGDRRR